MAEQELSDAESSTGPIDTLNPMDKNKAGNGGEIILHFLIVDKKFSRFLNEAAFQNLFKREKNGGLFEGVADIKCYGVDSAPEAVEAVERNLTLFDCILMGDLVAGPQAVRTLRRDYDFTAPIYGVCSTADWYDQPAFLDPGAKAFLEAGATGYMPIPFLDADARLVSHRVLEYKKLVG